jgi:hypothetical protein
VSPARALLLGLALVAGGCTGETLFGSLSDVYRLEHESVRARLYDSELAIEYVDVRGGVPVRVSLRTTEATPAAGGEYDLMAVGDITGVLADGTEIPRIVEGTLELSEFENRPGGACAGDFDARMDAGRDILALTGRFDATIEVVTWPPTP